MDNALQARARELFDLSPLKQRKLERLLKYIGPLAGERCLDLGSDNGVISMLLREQGGVWSSADLSEETVQQIGALVQERVHHTDGSNLPGENGAFDLVAVVDMLEHVPDEQAFTRELERILAVGGALIVNVPNPIPGCIRSLRLRCGQTDERHGHLRAGYSVEALEQLLGKRFVLERSESYGRWFSEVVDFFITAAIDFVQRGKRGVKGQVVSVAQVGERGGLVRIYRILYPMLKLMTRLDELLPGRRGNMVIARFRRV